MIYVVRKDYKSERVCEGESEVAKILMDSITTHYQQRYHVAH